MKWFFNDTVVYIIENYWINCNKLHNSARYARTFIMIMSLFPRYRFDCWFRCGIKFQLNYSREKKKMKKKIISMNFRLVGRGFCLKWRTSFCTFTQNRYSTTTAYCGPEVLNNNNLLCSTLISYMWMAMPVLLTVFLVLLPVNSRELHLF